MSVEECTYVPGYLVVGMGDEAENQSGGRSTRCRTYVYKAFGFVSHELYTGIEWGVTTTVTPHTH